MDLALLEAVWTVPPKRARGPSGQLALVPRGEEGRGSEAASCGQAFPWEGGARGPSRGGGVRGKERQEHLELCGEPWVVQQSQGNRKEPVTRGDVELWRLRGAGSRSTGPDHHPLRGRRSPSWRVQHEPVHRGCGPGSWGRVSSAAPERAREATAHSRVARVCARSPECCKVAALCLLTPLR